MYPIYFSLLTNKTKNLVSSVAQLLALSFMIMSTGCSLRESIPSNVSTSEKSCLDFFYQLDSAIDSHTIFEASSQRIDGYPIYRSNRFLASFTEQPLSPAEHLEWKKHLHENASNAYNLEVTRLPISIQKSIAASIDSPSINQGITQCSIVLEEYFIEKEKRSPLNTERLLVNDSYSTPLRFFGLYSFTSLLAQSSIEDYQEMMMGLYKQGPGSTPTDFYSPKQRAVLNANTIQQLFSEAYKNSPLSIPALPPSQLANVLSHFSPNLSIESNSNSDRIGSPKWKDNGNIWIDTQEPKLYTFISYTRHNNKILMQLNYGFWFPDRPSQTSFDIYAGPLDGIIWRVTLDHLGQPLVYDSIHQCGCYHKVFLPDGISHNITEKDIESPLFFDLNINASHPVTLHIDSESHYIVGVSQTDVNQRKAFPDNTTDYTIEDYQTLSQLSSTKNKKSLFGSDGIIQQSARKERWFLWPLGVVNAGAMRQKGNHAIAFIGRRHFDDAYLWEELNINKNTK